MYIKNTHALETLEKVNFWLNTDTPSVYSEVKFAKGTAAINGTEQTIANINTAPAGITTWISQGIEPSVPLIGDLDPGQFQSIWIWWHYEPLTPTLKDDAVTFKFSCFVTTGGTGGCPAGQHLEAGVCVPDTPPTGGCPAGQHLEGGVCVPNVPPPVTIENYKVAAVGDWGCESMTTNVVNRIVSRGINLVLGTGDNAYASSSCWFTRVKPIDNRQSSTIRLETTMGNHEYEESGGEAPYKTHFGYSKTYFSFQYQNLYVLVCDTNISMDANSAQRNFIQTDLAQASSNPSIHWKFAIFHHPMFGASSTHSYDDANSVENLMDLFVANKVSLVVCGHNHNWQRTFPVKRNTSSATSPTKVVSSTGPYTIGSPENWMIHAVSGGGGHDSGSSLYSLGSQPSFQAYQNRTNNGYLEIVATNNAQTMTCSFINDSGDSLHSWVMTRTAAAPGPTVSLDVFGVKMLNPTKSGGTTWFSTLWENGSSRVLNDTNSDSFDARFEYSDGTPPAALTINGDGTATANTECTSYRLYADGPWTNTEVTAYVKIRGTNTARSNSPATTGTGARNIGLHSRSSHSLGGSFNINMCHFGGYSVLWDRDLNNVSVQIEILDHIINRDLGTTTIPAIPLNQWIGYKQITRTITSSGFVKVEGYINYTPDDQATWVKQIEFTFTGTNTDFDVLHGTTDAYYNLYQCCKTPGIGACTSPIDYTPVDTTTVASDLIANSRWTQAERMCWVRTDDCKDVDFKFFSCREIDPL